MFPSRNPKPTGTRTSAARHSRRFFGDALKRGWRRGPELNRRIKVLQTSALPLGYRATLVQFSILDSRTEARSISRKPRTDASALRRAQLSRSTFCLRCAATPPFTANPSRAGDTEAHSTSSTTTKPSAEGDTKASAEDAAGVSPRSRRAAKPRLSPKPRTTLRIHTLCPVSRMDFSRLSRCPSSHSCFRPDRGARRSSR